MMFGDTAKNQGASRDGYPEVGWSGKWSDWSPGNVFDEQGCVELNTEERNQSERLRWDWKGSAGCCSSILCSFNVVYFEKLYLAVSWFSYSSIESTRGVLGRSSLVLWWIVIILLISLVPAVHQLNCWVLLMLTLASATLSKSTVVLSVLQTRILQLGIQSKLDLFNNWLKWVPQGSHLISDQC